MATNLPPFPEDMIAAAFKKADGRCECKDKSHGSVHKNGEPCNRMLDWDERRGATEDGGWWPHHLASNYGAERINLAIFCTDCSGLSLR